MKIFFLVLHLLSINVIISQNYEKEFWLYKKINSNQLLDSIYGDEIDLKKIFTSSRITETEVLVPKKSKYLFNDRIIIKFRYFSKNDAYKVFKELVFNSFNEESKQFSFHENVLGYQNIFVGYKQNHLIMLFVNSINLNEYNEINKGNFKEVFLFFKKNSSSVMMHKSSSMGSVFLFDKKKAYIIKPYNMMPLGTKFLKYFNKYERIIIKDSLECKF